MGTKRYFLSDAHLGGTAFNDDRIRELKLVRFLDTIKDDAAEIYLLGDIFDFWYEYRHVVPKGSVRLLGKLAELADSGIAIHFFIGNHDIWTYGYLEKEIGMKVYRNEQIIELDGKRFFLQHGDMVGYRPFSVRLMQAIFHSEIIRRIYNTIHPWFNMSFGLAWSRHNRLHKHRQEDAQYYGEDKEYLVQFAKQYNEKEHIDFFVFGHRHVMLDLMITKDSRVIYLGDWISHFSYGVYDEEGFRLEIFEEEN